MGCGQLGSRHLQAVASLPSVREIEVVDPRPEALALGRERLMEISDRQPSIGFRWLSSLDESSKGGDLCIIATLADVRCELVRQVARGLGYSNFLVEKVVAQSIPEYMGLMEFEKENGLSVWVNCKSRAYDFHKRLKELLDPAEPVVYSVVGGNHGLANNGIHHADLFAFFDESGCIKSAGSRIDPVPHPSKRGESMRDLSGTLHGYTEKGSQFTVSYARDHDHWEHISIATRRYRCVVDHLQRCAFESDADSGWSWRQAPFDGNPWVSNMTKAFATEILTSRRCELPTLEECFVAHQFILSELLPHFNNLLGVEEDRCPVT